MAHHVASRATIRLPLIELIKIAARNLIPLPQGPLQQNSAATGFVQNRPHPVLARCPHLCPNRSSSSATNRPKGTITKQSEAS
jgi:hypothetical protein